ncbi:membrane protein insertase YidC [SAR92 clade bacterium H455]|uniref:Membrane protein insertase YidC n=1 Tax=SAR92 clade bacterium H455 TaxID=2974818 RepID=A0ABY5TMW2_9GAMM|nr:membrane protein insertase YidC [SAR92 clade bacterium H455]
MDWKKSLNIAAIGFVAWLLIIEWSNFQDNAASQIPQQQTELTIPQPSQLPALETQQATQLSNELPSLDPAPVAVVEKRVDTRLVTVTTDTIEVTIDTLGGDIVQVKLLKHLTKMAEDGGEPFTLLTRSSKNEYIAQSGLIGQNGTDTREGRGVYSTSASEFSIGENQSTLNVDLTLNQNGTRLVKRFSFSRSDYVIGVSYLINNSSYEPWEATFYGQIKRDSHEPLVESSGGIQPYLGAALREADKNFAKYDFGDIEDGSIKSAIQGGWVAMVQHYFVSAWIPPRDENNNFSLRKLSGQDVYLMGFTGEKIQVAPGAYGEYNAQFYVGPKDQVALEELAEYLDLTVDYGFLWMLAKPIFAAMKFIHSVVGNWGWSIIILTIGIKILLYPLSAASLRSMAKMRSLQPKMERLKETYGDDRQKMSQELMGLYKKEKVNPAGGCFPMLLQMPVFLALYWVLLESVEIRHSPWIFWIDDLSAKDPFFILPLIMGASMLLMQKLQPMPTDPTQAMVMKIMPIAFTFFFMIFPSGLVLYWTVNNLLSMFQQWYVNRQLASASAAASSKAVKK